MILLIVELRPAQVTMAQVEELLASPPGSPTWTEILAETESSTAPTPTAAPDVAMAAEESLLEAHSCRPLCWWNHC